MFQSLSFPLQKGIRFFYIPISALPSAFLTVCFLLTSERNTDLPSSA
jgi:hypothetical protein